MPFRGAPLSAGYITLGDLGGTLLTLLGAQPCSGMNPFCALCCPPVEHWGVTGADPRCRLPQASPNFPEGPVYISFRPERCPHHTERNGDRVLQDSNGRGHCYTYHSPFLPRSKQLFTSLHVFKVVLNYWYSFLLKFPGYVQAFKLFYIEVKVTWRSAQDESGLETLRTRHRNSRMDILSTSL